MHTTACHLFRGFSVDSIQTPKHYRSQEQYTRLMNQRTTSRVSLTALLGTPVTDPQGSVCGKLKDIAVATGADAGKVAGLVLKTRAGLALVPSQEVRETAAGTLEISSASA